MWRGNIKCRNPAKCRIKDCHHHSLLHRKQEETPEDKPEEKTCNHQQVEGESLYKIIPVVLKNGQIAVH